MKYLKKSTIIVALSALQWLGLSEFASAGKAELDALLSQSARPTMQQVLEAAGPEVVAQNPYMSPAIQQELRFSQIKYLPHVIAFMEKAFPGALWAPLGRDAVIFGDLLEAFYLSIGQPGRVSRLNASGNSFISRTNEDRVRFLESAGLNLADPKKRPFVGVDRTGHNTNSQGYLLLVAAYKAYAMNGGNPEELVPYINFLGLSAALDPIHASNEVLSQYFGKQQYRSNLKAVANIIQLPVGGWTDSTPWHDTFGKLAEQPNGKFEGTVGAQHSRYHAHILGEMIEIYHQVATPEFAEAVKDAAHKLGYEFPIGKDTLERLRLESERMRAEAKVFAEKAQAEAKIAAEKAQAEAKIERERIRVEKIRLEAERKELLAQHAKSYPEDLDKRFKTLISAMPKKPEGEQETYFTANGKKLANWLNEEIQTRAEIEVAYPGTIPDNLPVLYLISEVSLLMSGDHLSNRDYRRLLARAFSASNVTETYVSQLSKIYDRYPVLREALKSKAEFFLTTYKAKKRAGTENTESTYRKIRELVMKEPIDCQDVYLDPVANK
jgi:hypothetical protein